MLKINNTAHFSSCQQLKEEKSDTNFNIFSEIIIDIKKKFQNRFLDSDFINPACTFQKLHGYWSDWGILRPSNRYLWKFRQIHSVRLKSMMPLKMSGNWFLKNIFLNNLNTVCKYYSSLPELGEPGRSRYFWSQTISVKNVKSNWKNFLESILRHCLTELTVDIDKFVSGKQCQSSHWFLDY